MVLRNDPKVPRRDTVRREIRRDEAIVSLKGYHTLT